jgi:hypothetical protein
MDFLATSLVDRIEGEIGENLVTEVVVQGTLKPDGTLELNQPVGLPPGEVRVIVQPMATQSTENVMAVLERIWAERRAKGMQGRSGERIDADIRAMRGEWEDRQHEIEQARSVKE